MDNILRDLLLNGYMIFPKDDKFIVKKEAVPSNGLILEETEHNNYDLALEYAGRVFNGPKILEWTVIVRYNRGLGIEYRTLSDVYAMNQEEAETLACEAAEQALDGAIVHEIKVRMKNIYS